MRPLLSFRVNSCDYRRERREKPLNGLEAQRRRKAGATADRISRRKAAGVTALQLSLPRVVQRRSAGRIFDWDKLQPNSWSFLPPNLGNAAQRDGAQSIDPNELVCRK